MTLMHPWAALCDLLGRTWSLKFTTRPVRARLQGPGLREPISASSSNITPERLPRYTTPGTGRTCPWAHTVVVVVGHHPRKGYQGVVKDIKEDLRTKSGLSVQIKYTLTCMSSMSSSLALIISLFAKLEMSKS